MLDNKAEQAKEGQIEVEVNWDEQPLGEKPDSHIAEDVGVSREAVRLQRSKRGIPRYRPSEPENSDSIKEKTR